MKLTDSSLQDNLVPQKIKLAFSFDSLPADLHSLNDQASVNRLFEALDKTLWRLRGYRFSRSNGYKNRGGTFASQYYCCKTVLVKLPKAFAPRHGCAGTPAKACSRSAHLWKIGFLYSIYGTVTMHHIQAQVSRRRLSSSSTPVLPRRPRPRFTTRR